MERNNFGKGEFMEFMDKFLDQHPEVVKDQRLGWTRYWDPRKRAPASLTIQKSTLSVDIDV